MTMTKKDYRIIAEILARQLFYTDINTSEDKPTVRESIEITADLLANRFEHTNPDFNKEKFMLTAISRSAL